MSLEISPEERLKALKSRRSSIKGRLTKFKNYLECLALLETVSSLEIKQLSMKISRLQSLFSDYDEVQSQIEILSESNQAEELTIRDHFEQEFDSHISVAQDYLETHSPSREQSAHNTSCSLQCHHDNSDVLGFKLPVIKIPTFDGTCFKWLEFKETYVSLVHDNNKIKNVHKFHYLLSYLEGEAARVLSNLEVSDSNYSEAWQLLCKRYDNKRQLINNHLKALFSIESVRETDKSLRFIVDHITKNLRALCTLGLPADQWDILIIYMVSAKLDSSTCYKWEEHRTTLPEIPTLQNFFDFLKTRADVLETVNKQKHDKNRHLPPPPPPKHQSKSLALMTKPAPTPTKTIRDCVLCQGHHSLYECTVFKSKTPQDRVAIVSSLNLCENCLRVGHKVQTCRLPGSCRSCKQKHNTLLHIPNETENPTPSTSGLGNTSTSLSAMTNDVTDVLLCTALVQLKNPITNKTLTVRTMLDSASQSTYITENVQQILNLAPQPSNISIVGLSDTPINVQPKRCALLLQSLNDPFNVNMTCLVIPKIVDKLPKVSLDVSRYDLSNFLLADPGFYKPSSIDMLIGADLFWDLIGSTQHSLGPHDPILRSSKLGWLIAGPLPTLPTLTKKQTNNKKVTYCNFLLQEPNIPNIDNELSRFWELENIPQSQAYSKEEKMCEQHFISNTYRLPNGRFCVRLPLRDEKECLGNSYSLAKKRFLSLEARFKKQPELKTMYSDFIHEYAALDHLEEAPIPKPNSPHFFLPHHPIIRSKSESTRLRVVFDASARSTSDFSVNDLQMVGPVIQDSIFNILLRFRQYKYILSGDCEKMYRQVLVDPLDRDLQLILWRDNEDEPLRTLRLKTVTYGLSSASFLSTRCIWQLGDECNDPVIKNIIQRDFYCDDLLTGADSEDELRYIHRQVSNELAKGCFHLRKYRSNLQSLFSDLAIPEEGNLIISNATSTLGIGWSPISDNLQFEVEAPPNDLLTKRSILSSTFRIFDPLGLLSLCTIKPKILIQTLWAIKLDWDEEVPENIKKSWLKFSQGVEALSSLEVSRRVLIDNPTDIQMHTFCDSSQAAYGACVYLRSTNAEGDVRSSLLCAKARVAPLKATTIPRLELCAALLGAQLSSAVTQALRCQISRHVYWSDAKVVLGWLRTAHKTKTFVATRVAAIAELSDPMHWRYVPTTDNPADLCSRGVDPQNVKTNDLWWHGPAWLCEPEASWPTTTSQVIELPELKAFPALVADPAPTAACIDVTRFSKLQRAQRVCATVHRFIYNIRNPQNKLTGTLSVEELQRALNCLIKFSQNDSFPNEVLCLGSKKPLPHKSNLNSLNPFIDDCGLVRVGGRLNYSDYPYSKKYPIILNAKHHLTQLIFQAEHESLLHAPPQLLLGSIRDQYWPIGGRKLARDVYDRCFTCRRFKGEGMVNIMSSLPPDRIDPGFPFYAVALDMGGPYLITDRKGRGAKITKCYLCVLICCRYRCIHLEAVSELSKDAFILALTRFIARRGRPIVIYCDNGRNFVAGAKEINNFFEMNKNSISDFAAHRKVEFKFSPAYAPHFNGLAEAGIRSAKFHIRRILGQTHLTFEELASLFAQIEAILNSRPLCPLSPSPNDLQPLTPGHFIIGRPLTSLPTPSFVDTETSRLNRFQRLEQVRQHFWKRWSREYIAELQQRTKWRTKSKELQLDDLVLIKDDTPPLYWRLGRVSKLFPGPDGVPRVADVSTAHGTVRRALNRLCLLPTERQA